MSGDVQVALIKLGRLVTTDVLRNVDSLPAGTTFFQRGSVRLERKAPILVDHDADRPVGFVRELCEFPDTDGEWVAVLAQITDPPEWLKRGTPASIAYFKTPWRQQLGATERILRAHVPEVSVLSPGVEPRQPGARIAVLHPATEEERRWRAGDQVIYGGPPIRRYAGGSVTAVGGVPVKRRPMTRGEHAKYRELVAAGVPLDRIHEIFTRRGVR